MTEMNFEITQGSGVIWVSDPLHPQSLQEEWGCQLPHQVNRHGIGLKDDINAEVTHFKPHIQTTKGQSKIKFYVCDDISILTFPISGDQVTEI